MTCEIVGIALFTSKVNRRLAILAGVQIHALVCTKWRKFIHHMFLVIVPCAGSVLCGGHSFD